MKRVLPLLLAMTAIAVMASAAVVGPVIQPIGVAADATKVWVVTGWCNVSKDVYDITTGTPVFVAHLTPAADADCIEPYIAFAPGLAGFHPGDAFIPYQGKVYKVTPPGVTEFATFSAPPAGQENTGMVFDTVGTYGYNMIVQTEEGTAYVINSAGTVIKTLNNKRDGAAAEDDIESPDVAPLYLGPYGGYLWFGGEETQKLYAASPLPGGPVIQFPYNYGGVRPEVIRFPHIPNACTVNVGGVPYSYFTSLYGQNQVGLFTLPPNTKAVLNDEYGGHIHAISPLGEQIGLLYSTGTQLEEGTTVTPRVDTPSCPLGGCVLTQGGYKNHFNDKVMNFPPGGLYLGNLFYTNAQLNEILQANAIRGNGLLSLAHQLITAQLNIFYGALPPENVANAVVAANVMIGNLVVPPIAGAGRLTTAEVGTLQTLLDNFNNGLLPGAPHCW